MKKEISISRRSKYKDFSEGIEYILSTDNRPLISCTNLSEIANYALSLSKNRGLDSIILKMRK